MKGLFFANFAMFVFGVTMAVTGVFTERMAAFALGDLLSAAVILFVFIDEQDWKAVLVIQLLFSVMCYALQWIFFTPPVPHAAAYTIMEWLNAMTSAVLVKIVVTVAILVFVVGRILILWVADGFSRCLRH